MTGRWGVIQNFKAEMLQNWWPDFLKFCIAVVSESTSKVLGAHSLATSGVPASNQRQTGRSNETRTEADDEDSNDESESPKTKGGKSKAKAKARAKAKTKDKAPAKAAWPKKLSEQITIVRQSLQDHKGPNCSEAIPKRFKSVKADAV